MLSFLTVGALAASLMSPTVAVQAAPYEAPPAYTTTGLIHPNGNPGWCMTATGIITGLPVILMKCLGGDRAQIWFSYRLPYDGGINLASYPDAVVARIKSRKAVQIFYGTKPGDYNSLIEFTPFDKGWLMDIKQGKSTYFITVPTTLKAGRKYPVNFTIGTKTEKKQQEWEFFPAWKKLDDVVVSVYNIHAAV
jgi:hypothetical protein